MRKSSVYSVFIQNIYYTNILFCNLHCFQLAPGRVIFLSAYCLVSSDPYIICLLGSQSCSCIFRCGRFCDNFLFHSALESFTCTVLDFIACHIAVLFPLDICFSFFNVGTFCQRCARWIYCYCNVFLCCFAVFGCRCCDGNRRRTCKFRRNGYFSVFVNCNTSVIGSISQLCLIQCFCTK